MRKLLILLVSLLLPAIAEAQEIRNANFMFKYDLDATVITYCRVEGKGGDPFGGGVQGSKPINISSANGNVTATTALSAPFFGLAVNDVVTVRYGTGVIDQRVIVTFTDSDTIVVDSAFTTTTTGIAFEFYKTRCGTTVNDGWIDIGNYAYRSIAFQIEQVNVTGGIDVQWQCKDSALGSQPIQVFPSCTTGACNTFQNYAGIAGITSRTKLVMNEPWAACRVGIKINSADDGGDLTTNAEQLTATVTVQLQR